VAITIVKLQDSSRRQIDNYLLFIFRISDQIHGTKCSFSNYWNLAVFLHYLTTIGLLMPYGYLHRSIYFYITTLQHITQNLIQYCNH